MDILFDTSLQPNEIETLYACIATDGNGREGLISFYDPESGWMPMVTSTTTTLEVMKTMAQHITKKGGQKAILKTFVLQDSEPL
jgi:hypothetical protein